MFVAFALLAVWLSAQVAVPGIALTTESETGRVARGGEAYAQHCGSCHGEKLEGQPDWRKRLPNGRLPAPPHDETGHTWHHPDWQLFDMTKTGRNPTAFVHTETDMPAFANVLTDEEIWAVLEFIKSTWPEKIRRRQADITQNVTR